MWAATAVRRAGSPRHPGVPCFKTNGQVDPFGGLESGGPLVRDRAKKDCDSPLGSLSVLSEPILQALGYWQALRKSGYPAAAIYMAHFVRDEQLAIVLIVDEKKYVWPVCAWEKTSYELAKEYEAAAKIFHAATADELHAHWLTYGVERASVDVAVGLVTNGLPVIAQEEKVQ